MVSIEIRHTVRKGHSLLLPSSFHSRKKKNHKCIWKEKQCLSDQHVLDEPEIKAFKAKAIVQSLNQNLGNCLKTSAPFFEANNGAGLEAQAGQTVWTRVVPKWGTSSVRPRRLGLTCGAEPPQQHHWEPICSVGCSRVSSAFPTHKYDIQAPTQQDFMGCGGGREGREHFPDRCIRGCHLLLLCPAQLTLDQDQRCLARKQAGLWPLKYMLNPREV